MATEFGVLVSYPEKEDRLLPFGDDEEAARQVLHSINERDSTPARARLARREVTEWELDPR